MKSKIYFSEIKNKMIPVKNNQNTIDQMLQQLNKKIVVLDDDPTGIQTVHDVNVYTDWSFDSIFNGFKEEKNIFFILTNSRSMTEANTITVHKQIARNIVKAAELTKKDFIIISRSDSTLRGHYPAETETLMQCITEMGYKVDGEIIIPFFKEGGRVTINDIHYVLEGDYAVPVSETEFSQDSSFGFENSNLKKWIAEKYSDENQKNNITSISLDQLRNEDFDEISYILNNVSEFNKVIVNAVEYEDIINFCIPLISVLISGKRFIYRTAASFVRILGNVNEKPLLKKNDLVDLNNNSGGLVIVGSHVHKTSVQLEALYGMDRVRCIVFDQHTIINPQEFNNEINRVTYEIDNAIKNGYTAVVYTRRKKLMTGDKNKDLKLTADISCGLVKIVTNLNERPSFLLAKGGITSSDIGTLALYVKKALVAGQVIPGVPVWKLGEESKFPGMSYIIFPGNVGNENSLREIIELCMK